MKRSARQDEIFQLSTHFGGIPIPFLSSVQIGSNSTRITTSNARHDDFAFTAGARGVRVSSCCRLKIGGKIFSKLNGE